MSKYLVCLCRTRNSARPGCWASRTRAARSRTRTRARRPGATSTGTCSRTAPPSPPPPPSRRNRLCSPDSRWCPPPQVLKSKKMQCHGSCKIFFFQSAMQQKSCFCDQTHVRKHRPFKLNFISQVIRARPILFFWTIRRNLWYLSLSVNWFELAIRRIKPSQPVRIYWGVPAWIRSWPRAEAADERAFHEREHDGVLGRAALRRGRRRHGGERRLRAAAPLHPDRHPRSHQRRPRLRHHRVYHRPAEAQAGREHRQRSVSRLTSGGHWREPCCLLPTCSNCHTSDLWFIWSLVIGCQFRFSCLCH